MEMSAGKIYGLLGKNGAGKSTLMKNLAGLLFPTQGVCLVNDFQPCKREPAFLEQLFYIPEECYLPPLTIHQFQKVYAPFYPLFNNNQFQNYLTEFGIDTQSHLNSLSFGQKKKAFIAFGLSVNTRLLIMDEPTNGLDIPSKVQFRNIMTQARREDQVVLLSTHQVRDLDDVITSLIIIDNNQILLYKDKDELRKFLHFSRDKEVSVNENVFYSEETLNGIVSISTNALTKTSYIDLEILFNATLSNPGLINKVFEGKPINY